jgi:hypothetical protein
MFYGQHKASKEVLEDFLLYEEMFDELLRTHLQQYIDLKTKVVRLKIYFRGLSAKTSSETRFDMPISKAPFFQNTVIFHIYDVLDDTWLYMTRKQKVDYLSEIWISLFRCLQPEFWTIEITEVVSIVEKEVSQLLGKNDTITKPLY